MMILIIAISYLSLQTFLYLGFYCDLYCDLDFNIPWFFYLKAVKISSEIFLTNFIHNLWIRSIKMCHNFDFGLSCDFNLIILYFASSQGSEKQFLRYCLSNIIARYNTLVITIILSYNISDLGLLFNLDIVQYSLVLQFLQLTVAI